MPLELNADANRKENYHRAKIEMANANNLVKSENLTVTCDYPIVNVCNTWSTNKVIKTEKSDISASDVLQKHSYGTVIKTEPANTGFSASPLIKAEKSELQGNSTSCNLTEHSCLVKNVEPIALVEDHGTPSPVMNQTRESLSARTAATDMRFVCDLCDKQLSSSSNLTRHKRAHTREKPFVCDLCDERFTKASKLVRHRQSHAGDKFPCDVCDKRFTSASKLVTHRRSHTGEKPFPCDICDKRFTHTGNLTVHKRLHSGEKPFSCDLCDKQFRKAFFLVSHKLMHTGEKPFACDECSKRFRRTDTLRIHKRSHTGEKPFVCDVCNKRFPCSSHLVTHKRSHTGGKQVVAKDLSNVKKGLSPYSAETEEKPSHCGGIRSSAEDTTSIAGVYQANDCLFDKRTEVCSRCCNS